MQGFKHKKGFTIIETMISVSIFTLIVVFGINVLLNVNLVSNKSKDMREIMDNLSFVMEEMSRNLRTGYDYHCEPIWIGSNPPGDIDIPQDCPSGWYLGFKEARSGGDQWVYEFEDDDGDGNYNISKSEDGGVSFAQLNSPEVALTGSTSYFAVVGSSPPSSGVGIDQLQPFIIIRLSGVINYKNTETPFNLQTTVSQRLIDIPLP